MIQDTLIYKPWIGVGGQDLVHVPDHPVYLYPWPGDGSPAHHLFAFHRSSILA